MGTGVNEQKDEHGIHDESPNVNIFERIVDGVPRLLYTVHGDLTQMETIF